MKMFLGIKYKITKAYGKRRGEIELQLKGGSSDKITVQELCDAFGTKPEEDSTDEDDDDKSAIYDIEMTNLQAKGVIDMTGESSLFLTGNIRSNLPLFISN